MTHREAFKTFLVVLFTAIAIIIAVWFIPAFMNEIKGNFNCKAVGDVTVCWSIK